LATNGRRSATSSPSARSTSGRRSRKQSGTLIGDHPLVIAAGHLHDLAALIAGIGGRCVASGPTAAAVHGFDGFVLAPPFHVTIERGRFIERDGHVVHTNRRLEGVDLMRRHGLPVLTPTRTIIDLATTATIEELTRAIDSATRDRLTTDDALHRRLVALRGRGRTGAGRLLDALAGIEVTRGGHSWLEREFLRLVRRSGLPRPDVQVVLGQRGRILIRVDCRFPGTSVVVELLGYAFHRTVTQMQRDADRMNNLLLDGHTVLQFTYTDVVERPDAVLATLRTALPTVA
jgi:hypothetical protein